MKKNSRYPFSVKVIKYDDNDYEYEVNFKDFAEVVGIGDSIEEAIEEAEYNLDAYLKYCQLKKISIPEASISKPLDEYSGKITVRIPKNLHRDISEFAEIDGMSINSLAIDAFRFYLNSNSLQKITNDTVEKIETCIDNAKEKTEEFIKYKYGAHEFKNEENYIPAPFGGIGGFQYAKREC